MDLAKLRRACGLELPEVSRRHFDPRAEGQVRNRDVTNGTTSRSRSGSIAWILRGWMCRTIAAAVLAGYAHVGTDASFAGPNAVFVTNAVRGILDQAAINTALLGVGLELIYERKFQGDLAMTTRARYNELAAIVTSASDPSLKQNGGFGIATGSVAFSGPTDWRIANHAIRWIGYTNGTWLSDTDRSTLGFNAFAEIGGGLQLIAPDVVQGVRGGTMRASAIVGPGVTGWLVSAALDF